VFIINRNIDRGVMWIWLAQRCKPASKLVNRIFECPSFSSVEDVYAADAQALSKLSEYGISDELISELENKSTVREENIWNWCVKNRISVISRGDSLYPKVLLSLLDAPVLLYCKGTMPDLNRNLVIAAVGTRKMSDYGKNVAYEMGRGLAAGGAILVSGMALGIDGMAMSGALDVDGTTIAVLGCGIDRIYPSQHALLFDKIAKQGAVITEYPPGTPPAGVHFPVRNRIISGISQGVVVIEADMRSGSLITASHAIYQARDVFAVPGQVKDNNSSGTNHLIKEGVSVATCSEDILQKYVFLYPHSVNLQAARVYGTTSGAESDAGAKRNKIGSTDPSPAEKSGVKRKSGAEKSTYGSGLYGGKATEIGSDKQPAKSEESQKKETPVIDFAKMRIGIASDKVPPEIQTSATNIETENKSETALSAEKSSAAKNVSDAEKVFAESEVLTEAEIEHFDDFDINEIKKHVRYINGEKVKSPNEISAKQAASEEKKSVAAEAVSDVADTDLSEDERDIYSQMPRGKAVGIDWFTARGYSAAYVMSVMTSLEIYGLVEASVGGTYIKRG